MTRTRWSLLAVLLVAVLFVCGYATLATADRVSHPASAVTNVMSGSDGLTAASPDVGVCGSGSTSSTDGLVEGPDLVCPHCTPPQQACPMCCPDSHCGVCSGTRCICC